MHRRAYPKHLECFGWHSGLGAVHYVDTQVQDPAAELLKLGGAKVILASVTSGDAMSAVLAGRGINGKLIIVGTTAEPLQVLGNPLLLGSWVSRPATQLILGIRSPSAFSLACAP